MRELDDVLQRAHGRRGAQRLRSVLGEHYAGATITKTEIEERCLQICRAAGLPQPEVNVRLAIPGEEWQSLRARPAARSAPHGRRLAGRQIHVEPNHRRAAIRRGHPAAPAHRG